MIKYCVSHRRYLYPIFFCAVVLLVSFPCLAKKKLYLDDVNIKGEVHHDDRVRFLPRPSFKFKNFVKYRTNFREEITQGLLVREPTINPHLHDM